MISYLPATLLLSALTCITASTSTTVSVLEFGPKGSVRPTTASSPLTSVGGVTSFWNAIHNLPASRSGSSSLGSLTTQYPGMTVVPDLFQRPKGGIVLGIVGNGVDVEEMPTLATLVEQQEDNVVGQFHLKGAQGKTLLRQVSTTKVQDGDELESMTLSKAKSISSPTAKHHNTLSSVVAHVDGDMTPQQMDNHLKRTLEAISQHAQETQSSIIVHLIVEEDASEVAHRRLSTSSSSDSSSSRTRTLQEDDDEEQDNENGENVAGMYAYFDEDTNEWVYPYKTMFQIQYYNIVLWTSIGLFAILATANLMTMNMPLMADTLLFGESAKMVAE